eukprot:CAMPEP_0178402924 /NCGR_PEP_ID=MMETSP0689_2-20121128/17103_1 /TAXON_ID=160604 /ORGANISM="Amphidinium massartii, Strain CS-259" /LENGTH=653 /DNA_ID=CAMNT_0020023861 /DNA_START=28 /DNA_END=1985 /DNA_ORIENTATION=+
MIKALTSRGSLEVRPAAASWLESRHAQAPAGARHYTPPNRHTWSKQHYRIRTPRPLVEKFDLSRDHPQKEWWRERRIAPATFLGFPDVTKLGLRGGELYVEQMDAVTLAVICDKCVKEGILDDDMWSKFGWRAQQISSRTHEPDLCYIFRAFARADWFDQNLLTTYLGRLHRRLPMFQLPDVTVLLEAFSNPRFRQMSYLDKTLDHLNLLLQHRDDAAIEDLAKACVALRGLYPLPAAGSSTLSRDVAMALELLAEALLLRDLAELSPVQAIGIIDCYVVWSLVGHERLRGRQATAALDLNWSLVRELKGKAYHLSKQPQGPDELAKLAFALARGGLAHTELWEELAQNLRYEAHHLSASSAAKACFAVSRVLGRKGSLHDCKVKYELCESLARRAADRRSSMKAMDLANAMNGLLTMQSHVRRGFPTRYTQEVLEQVLQVGADGFDAAATVVLLDALRDALSEQDARGQSGLQTLCEALLEKVGSQMEAFSPRQLASLVRTASSLLESTATATAILKQVLDRVSALLSPLGDVEDGSVPDFTPQDLAMLCQSLASLSKKASIDAAGHLTSLLPTIQQSLMTMRPNGAMCVQFFGSLVECPASELRSAVLTELASEVQQVIGDLSAGELVLLSEALLVFIVRDSASKDAWTCP